MFALPMNRWIVTMDLCFAAESAATPQWLKTLGEDKHITAIVSACARGSERVRVKYNFYVLSPRASDSASRAAGVHSDIEYKHRSGSEWQFLDSMQSLNIVICHRSVSLHDFSSLRAALFYGDPLRFDSSASRSSSIVKFYTLCLRSIRHVSKYNGHSSCNSAKNIIFRAPIRLHLPLLAPL